MLPPRVYARIGVRELRQHASRYLDRVKSGETVEVTERGYLVALLVPPSAARDARERLIADGRLVPASAMLRLPRRVQAHRSSEAVLDELREGPMIYLDSSALLKLLFEGSESAALAQWMTERADTAVVSSQLATVEVLRATRRLDADAVPAARALLSQLDLIPLSGTLIAQAADTGDPLLRTLDALHLASALSIRDELSAFVAYGNRLHAAAEAAGMAPIQPGDTSAT